MDQFPPRRRPDQIFILHNHERSYMPGQQEHYWANGFLRPAWKRLFNWTMTFRTDSDFFVPYGVVRKRPTPVVNKDYKAIVKQKTKMAACLVSHCNVPSQRLKYVKELQKYIPVDIYGKCGSHSCPRAEHNKCTDMISNTYKFYISFENTICPDYITEKFFRFLMLDTVVIVRGGNQYFTHAPREIFLNTADFPSPKELAKRMLYLHHNDSAYIDILQEKDKYTSFMEDYPVHDEKGLFFQIVYRFESPVLCRVCQHLWNLDKYAKSVPDIHKWFDRKPCSRPTDLNF